METYVGMAVCGAVLIILSLLFRRSIGESSRAKDELLDIQKEIIVETKKIVQDSRKEIHDYKNDLNIILGMCYLEEDHTIESIKDYIQGITHAESMSYSDTGNPMLDSLLLTKKHQCRENDISLRVTVKQAPNLRLVDANELLVILSHLLDEAAANLNEGSSTLGEEANSDGISQHIEKQISVCFESEHNTLQISISRNGQRVIKTVDKSQAESKNIKFVKDCVKRCKGEFELLSNKHQTSYIITFKGGEPD